jgi:membrane-associated protein
MESLIEIFHHVKEFLNPKFIIEFLLEKLGPFVYVGLFFIVFSETGLAVGFFLPGDSLLVVAGLFAAAGKLNIALLLFCLVCASIIGDSTGYWTGRKMGKRVFNRPKSLVFNPSRVDKAKKFFEKYGAKTVIMARFVPIVRTFAPIVAGAAQMPYSRFLPFSILGGFLWIFSMVLLGYFVGGMIERALGIKLEDHIEKVVIVVVLLSLTPPFIEWLKARRERRIKAEAESVEV